MAAWELSGRGRGLLAQGPGDLPGQFAAEFADGLVIGLRLTLQLRGGLFGLDLEDLRHLVVAFRDMLLGLDRHILQNARGMQHGLPQLPRAGGEIPASSAIPRHDIRAQLQQEDPQENAPDRRGERNAETGDHHRDDVRVVGADVLDPEERDGQRGEGEQEAQVIAVVADRLGLGADIPQREARRHVENQHRHGEEGDQEYGHLHQLEPDRSHHAREEGEEEDGLVEPLMRVGAVNPVRCHVRGLRAS